MFVILFALLSSAQASQLKVVSPHVTYSLNWSDTSFYFESPRAKLSLLKRDCSSHLLQQFNEKMKKWENLKVSKSPKSELTYTINGKSYGLALKSRYSMGLMALPIEIERVKMEEKLVCKDK